MEKLALFENPFYRGEALFSLPSKWAFFSTIIETILPYEMRIFEEERENEYFSISINEMSLHSSYVHAVKVYEDVTDLFVNVINKLEPSNWRNTNTNPSII